MSFASKVLYTGDSIITDFNIPMPYIDSTHINVFLNDTLQLVDMHYTFNGASTISFVDAPGIDDAILIRRNSSPTAILVDFINGSTLNESDLDTAYLHNYYLTQEYADSFNEVIQNALIQIATGTGIVEIETDAVIQALVTEMLSQAAASELQARITDIDLNAEAIVTLGEALQVQINTLAAGVAAAVYIQATEPVPGVGGIPNPIPEGARWYDSDDNNHPYIYQSSAWLDIDDPRVGVMQAQISVLQADVGDNAAAVLSEQTARSNADIAIASDLSLIGAANGGDTAFVIDLTTAFVGPAESLGTRFTTLSAATTAAQDDADTNAADIQTETTARTDADSAIASDVTTLQSRVTTTEGDILTNASGLSSLTTSVSTNAGNISSNAADITTLQSDVDLRSRTYMQASAPTVDLNAGDLWIDSDDNKLYRYNGTSWVEAQDAAIDGNAAALSSLSTDVTTNEGGISANASDISTVQTDITTLQGDVTTAQADIVTNASSISTAEGDISSNASAITGVQTTLGNRNRVFHQATQPTADNAGDLWIDTDDANKLYIWTGTVWSLTDNTAFLTAASSAITTLQSDTTQNGTDISTNASSITTLDSAITTVDGRVDTANITISANTSAVSSAQSTADDAVLDAAGALSSAVGAQSTADSKATTFRQTTPPTALATGDIWYDTDDSNKMYRWSGSSWADVQDANISTLYAKYGVTLNVNGYVTGFAQNNNGTTGTFVILADKFAVVDPSGDPAEPEYVPFSISGGKIVMTTDVTIDGDLLVTGSINGNRLINGTIGTTQIGTDAITTTNIGANQVTATEILAGSITASKINVTDLSAVNADLGTITAGTITMDTAGFIKGGQTAFNTGTGFFLGYDTGAYVFSIGNGTDNFLSWDGTTLQVIGDILVGEYSASVNTILSADTERTKLGIGYSRKKTFTIDRSGTIRVSADMKYAGLGTETNGFTPTSIRIYKNASIVSTQSTSSTTYETKTYDTAVVAGDEIHIDIEGGTRWVVGDGALDDVTGYIENARIKADIALTTAGSADLD